MNPAAFPSPGVVLPGGQQQGAYEGMTLRDYFAGQAMLTLLGIELGTAQDIRSGETAGQWVARKAYAMADLMIAARETA